MVQSPAYSISILCHNRRQMTDRCVKTVLQHSPRQTQVIITDNGSTDGTAELLQAFAKRDERIEIVTNETNLGVARPKLNACLQARGPLFVSLDNDAWVGPRWLEMLRLPLDRNPAVAQVGRVGQHQALHTDGIGHPNGPLEYIDGSCFMVRTEIAKDIGVCDPFFFIYADDSDFSLRLRARGHEIAVAQASVRHPPEQAKMQHGGVPDLGGHLETSKNRLYQRWKDYLRRRAFDPTIIIKRSGAMGDVVIASAAARRLKSLLPDCRIFFATNVPGALEGNPDIEAVLPVREWTRRAPQMAYAFDLDGVYEKNLSTTYWRSYAAALPFDPGEPYSMWKPRIALTDQTQKQVDAWLGDHERVAVVCTTRTGWPGKDVSPRLFDSAIAELRKAGFFIVEVGLGGSDFDDLVHINLTGQTSVQLLAGLMARAELYLGLDSGPYHVAGAFDTTCITFFGCTDPMIISSHERVIPVQAQELDCLGCHHVQAPGTTRFMGCRRGDMACLGVQHDAALRAVISYLDGGTE